MSAIVNRSITPFPREGTETCVVVKLARASYTLKIDNPISPRGDGNALIAAISAYCLVISITPFPREGTETFFNVAFNANYELLSITPFPREGTETEQRLELSYHLLHLIDNPISPRGDGNKHEGSTAQVGIVASITPFPREGTETSNGYCERNNCLMIDNPISPRGDGNKQRLL